MRREETSYRHRRPTGDGVRAPILFPSKWKWRMHFRRSRFRKFPRTPVYFHEKTWLPNNAGE